MNRRAEGAIVVLCVVSGITVALAMAVAWGPKQECVLQIPKIIGCAIGAYEGLAGGLIAAGGAVFAGWLAWSAARDQIDLAKRQTAEGALLNLEALHASAEFELSRLATAKETMLRLKERLLEKSNDTAPQARRLAEMSRRQEFLSTSQDINTQSMGGKLWESANRLRMLAQHIESRVSTTSAENRPGLFQLFEPDAAAAIEDFCAVTSEIDPFIVKQQMVVNDLKLGLTEAHRKLDRN